MLGIPYNQRIRILILISVFISLASCSKTECQQYSFVHCVDVLDPAYKACYGPVYNEAGADKRYEFSLEIDVPGYGSRVVEDFELGNEDILGESCLSLRDVLTIDAESNEVCFTHSDTSICALAVDQLLELPASDVTR